MGSIRVGAMAALVLMGCASAVEAPEYTYTGRPRDAAVAGRDGRAETLIDGGVMAPDGEITSSSDPDGGGMAITTGDGACAAKLAFQPLFSAPPTDERPLHWIENGVLFTRGAGRVRGRHENEAEFSKFHSLYFENRTFEFVVEDTIPSGGSTIRITWLPEVQNRGPNLRAFYTGDGNVFFHNVTMQEHALAGGKYSYDYVIERNFRDNRPLQVGDMVEFEFGVFLATTIEGRTNYYTDTYRYVVGTQALVPLAESPDALVGGEASTPAIVVEPELSFSQYQLNLPQEWLSRALQGRRRFHTEFTSGAHTENLGPALVELAGMAGPRINDVSCAGCHTRDGRGAPPAAGASTLGGVVLRLADASNPTRMHPLLGGQLQDRALSGSPEASFAVRWQSSTYRYPDGATAQLARPEFTVMMTDAPLLSSRLAPPIAGLGLLEALDESTILALADPNDCDQDGISGRANIVVDRADGATRLGRFGWRASKASLAQQTAAALANDMGVTNSMYPAGDCGSAQSGCDTHLSELPDEALELIATYVRSVGIPPRRGLASSPVRRGEMLFEMAGCESCHVDTMTTGTTHPIPSLRNQTIHAYTDMLLHDMGDGLADEVGDEDASGREWRTTPLWGLGLTTTVSGAIHLLHDGRAGSIEEAILWHDGESRRARDAFAAMSTSDRAAMIAFLESL